MVVLAVLFISLFVLFTVIFLKKKILLKGFAFLFLSIFLISFVFITTNSGVKHFYNILLHSLTSYEIVPIVKVAADKKMTLNNVRFPRSGVYEIRLIKKHCFTDSNDNYATKIELSGIENNFEYTEVFKKYRFITSTKDCSYPRFNTFVIGGFPVPTSFTEKKYNIEITIKSGEIEDGDIIVVQQSIYM